MIARDLKVTVRSVERWHRSWRDGGSAAWRTSALTPAGPPDIFAVLRRRARSRD